MTDDVMPPAGARGFTLVEMLIALLIFSLIAAAGVAMLSFSVRAQAAVGTKLDDIASLNRLAGALSADFSQAVNRPTRDAGGRNLPALVAGGQAGDGVLVQLVRRGWTNLDDAARPSEQKVAYRFVDGRMERVAYPLLDGAQALAPAVMLRDVGSARVRFRVNGAWSDQWTALPGQPLPQAAELVITRTGGTPFRLLFLVGTGYREPQRPAGSAPGGGGNAP
ncbi:MAG: type II secretion system minor pseudopilin GspJ [Sphingomonas sp.]